MGNLAFKSLFYGLISSDIDARILASKAIFKICWRLFFEYLAIKNIAGHIKLEVEPGTEGLKVFFSSFISLYIIEEAEDIEKIESIVEKATKVATEA